MTDREGARDRSILNAKQRLYDRREVLRFGVVGAGVLGAGSLLTACSSATTEHNKVRTGKRGGTLNFGRDTGPTQLDPGKSIVAGDVYTLDKIFEPLYITSPSGVLTPWLAQGHTMSSDGKTWTFVLRPGVKFSDGRPLTAKDVAFSIQRTASHPHWPLGFLDFAIKDFKATDSRTVTFELSQPWAPFLSDISVFANSIMPNNLGGESGSAFFANPIGTGPFLLKSFQKGAGVVLTRNKNYWQSGKPYLDEVSFSYIPDDNQRVEQLKGGEVDVISAVPAAQVATLKRNPSLVLREFVSWAVDLLLFNESVPQYKDRHVRRAIAHAIDIEQLAKVTTFGTAEAGNSFFPPSLEYYAKVPTLGFSLDAAKAELRRSGYPHGFSTSILVPSGNTQYIDAATVFQSELKALNIDVSIQQLDNAAYTTAFEAFNYEAMINFAINDISDPDEMASFQVDTQDGGSNSFWTSYDDPAAIALVREAEAQFDGAKRAELYAKIQAIVAQDAPYIALDYPPNIYAWRPSLHGFTVNPGGAYRLEDVWLG